MTSLTAFWRDFHCPLEDHSQPQQLPFFHPPSPLRGMLLASLSPVRLCFQKFPPLSPRQFLVYSSLTLFALVLAVYSHAFHCEFIDFDDNTHVFANPSVLAGLHPRSIFWVFSHFIAAQWIPLTWLSHMLDVSLFGTDPAFHHLTNLILHAFNSLLVFLVWQRLTRDPWPSLAVALLFAVHPINVESVAWIAERKNLLSSTFWLLALAAYSTHASRSSRSDRRYLWLTTAFMALGLLAKPMLVTLPFALL
ncbi:MAG: hypothetical protein NTX04_01465, partial [Verrucomicrobia bacterium]|nr:hypothetical protein [Verrucomicrobiota bacterium]